MKHRLLGFGLFLAVWLVLLESSAFAGGRWFVDGVHGSDSNDCRTRLTACKTIGHAISLAASGDTVLVGPATYNENLVITKSLTITGSSAKDTVIDGGGVNQVITNRAFDGMLVLSSITIQNGRSEFLAGGIGNEVSLTLRHVHVVNNQGHFGGGISNQSTLSIIDSIISRNQSSDGGAIYNTGTLTITNSAISHNVAQDGGGIFAIGDVNITGTTLNGNSSTEVNTGGGAILNDGFLTITNSTITGNSAADFGGGLDSLNQGSTALNNTTISGNSAPHGGGIFNTNQVTIQNSIIANSVGAGGNCAGSSAVTSNGYNLSSDGTCRFDNTGDINDADPRLGPLQNNGGPTKTQALLSGSPAIDAGNPAPNDGKGNHCMPTDQRGHNRTDRCEMGAYEEP